MKNTWSTLSTTLNPHELSVVLGVCVCKRQRETQTEKESIKIFYIYIFYIYYDGCVCTDFFRHYSLNKTVKELLA